VTSLQQLKTLEKTIDFFFDVGSPNAYLAYRVLPVIAARHHAAINMIPCLLGGIFKATGNQAPHHVFAEVKGKLDYERLEMERFVKRHHLTKFHMNPYFPVTTLLVMRGAVAARYLGIAKTYDETMFVAMWEQGRKLDDPAEFDAVLREANLPAEKIHHDAHTQHIKDELIANTEDAVARGVFGIPTFIVGRDMFFGKDRLHQVEEALHM
jgi:2-hydroxychromene-2-carboxylate isomerase